jgi:hypothetical protein
LEGKAEPEVALKAEEHKTQSAPAQKAEKDKGLPTVVPKKEA